MIPISKEVAQYIKLKSYNTPIPQTCKQKSNCKRKKRYVEESKYIQRLIDEYNKKYLDIIYDSSKQ